MRAVTKKSFTNDLIDKMVDIFISYRERADYKLALKLRHNRIIITLKDYFNQSDLIEIEFLLANSILEPVQYDSNKHASISLFKFRIIYEIKRKTTDKPYKKSCLVV